MKSVKLVYIKWCDAIHNNDGAWSELELVEKWGEYSDWEVESVGWLIVDKKEYVVLASKRETDQDGQIQLGLLLKIPKTWIRERYTLEKAKNV